MAVHMRKLLSMALILAMLLSVSIPGLGASVYAADEPGDGVLITSADDVPGAEFGDSGQPSDPGEAGSWETAEAPEAIAPLTAPVPFGITATSENLMPTLSAVGENLAFDATVSVEGEKVTYTIFAANDPGIFMLTSYVHYDAEVVENPSVTALGTDVTIIQEEDYSDSSLIYISTMNINATPSGDGGIFSVAFDIKASSSAAMSAFTTEILSWGSFFYDYSNLQDSSFITPFILGDNEDIVRVARIDGIPSTLILKPGQIHQFEPVVLSDDPEVEPSNTKLSWYSDNTDIVWVTQDGVITADIRQMGYLGEVTITATAMDGSYISAECTVTVVPSVTDVTLYPSIPLTALEPGETFQLTPTFTPANAGDQTGRYESSDESVVTVDETGGEVTAVGHGAAYVTFTANDGDGRYYAPVLFCVLDPEVTGTGPAASINGVNYDTLEAAVADGAGQTITLLRDQAYGSYISMPEGSTVDLNDHMLFIPYGFRIAENTSAVAIKNGTIVGGGVVFYSGSLLESLHNVKIMTTGAAVGGSGSMNTAWTLESVTDCDITSISSDPNQTASATGDASAVFYIFESGKINYIGGDTRVKAVGSVLFGGGYRCYGEVFVYGGEFDVPRIRSSSPTVHIYGGRFTVDVATGYMGSDDDIYGCSPDGNGWYVVTAGVGSETDLIINVDAQGATVEMYKLEGNTETPVDLDGDSSSAGRFVFKVNLQNNYKYVVTAAGYETETGYVSIAGKNRALTITLSEEGTSNPDTGVDIDRGEISGGAVITKGGTYRLAAPPANRAGFGVITVATREQVRIVGLGIGEAGHEGDRTYSGNANVMYSDLAIDSCAGADLIIKDIWTNNSHGQGTASGATNLGYTALNFTGKDNTLTVESVNLLENQEYVSSACIHVPKNAELTFKGEGTLYLYKFTAGAGIGGNAGQACGKLTFESGTYYIKGSKTGAVIGGDVKGSVTTNDDITFSGATVVVINVATGGAIGDSNQGTCAGKVYMKAGSLTIYTDYEGPGIGKGGTLIYTGGSLKTEMSYNAYVVGYGIEKNPAPGPYIYDYTIKAAKVDGSGNSVARLVFDTTQLKNETAPYSVTVNGETSAVPSVHNVDWIYSDNTIGNFGLYLTPGDQYYDPNLYFYLPMEAGQELIVNGETFIVSWDAESESFGIYSGGEYAVNLTASANGSLIASRAEAAEGETVTIAVNPNEGYRFVTGSLKLDGAALATINGVGRFTMPGKDVTLTAEFEALPSEEYDETRYTVDIADGIYGGRIEIDIARGVSGQKVTINVVPDTGFRLKPGSLKANGAAVSQADGTYFFVIGDANVTITAEFESLEAATPNGNKFKTGDAAKDFVLYIPMDFSLYDEEEGISLAGPGGSLTLTENDYTVTEGSTVVTINKSYMNSLPAGEYTLSVPFAGNVLVTASFALADALVYDITLSPSAGGNISASPAKAGEGETVTVTVTPAANYRLVQGSLKWDGRAINAGADGAYSFTMPDWDVTLTAEFTAAETPATPPVADEDVFKEGIRGSGDIYAPEWDGKSIDLRWFDPARDTYTINTPAELAGLAALVNGLYNSNIDTVAGKASYIIVHTGFGDDDGALGNNKSTPTYHYGEYDFAGKTVRLGRDIYMGESNNYMPIGGQYLMTRNKSETRVDASFNGTFDGGNHSVYIYTDRQVTTGNYGDGQSVGLIGRLGNHDNEGARASGQTVKNVAVFGSVKANRSVGGIVGKIGQTMDGATIDNCANFASVSSTDAKGVGGIVGAAWNKGVIKNCYNAGTVNAGYASPAGGIGGSVEILIENSYSRGKVTARPGYAMGIGTRNLSAPDPVNSYYLEGSAAGGGWYTGSSADNKGVRTSEYMKSDAFVTLLGSVFVKDTNGINDGYPVLRWQGGPSVTTPPTSGTDGDSRPTVNIPSTTTVKDGEAVTVIDIPEEGLALASGPSSRLIVNVDTGEESVNKITAELPAEFVKQASESNSEIEVRSEVANVLLPEKAVTELAKDGKDVSVKAEKDEAANTYTFTVESDGKALATVEGGIRAAIPVSDASVGTVAVLVHEDGTEEIIKKSATVDGELLVPLAGSAVIRIEDRAKSFSDVSADAWYTDAVKFVTSRELFNGTSETEFSPNASMTRAMLVTVLYRLENEPETGAGDIFSDVSATGYYARAVAWASENGIVEGVGEGIFSPNAEITREQLAAMLYRYASAQGLDVSARGNISSFMDANNVSSWAGEALAWAVGAGIITGRSNPVGTELAPKGTATRAEVAAMIERLIERAAKI